ncbi:MAG: SDR family NAD(P)-dependent oxidoreductase [Geminicoccaceae bacterium]
MEAGMGPITRAILNAGTHRPVDARAFRAEGLARLVDVNLMGPARCIEALMPGMIERRSGQIAIVASVAGYRGLPTAAYYSATKAGVIAMAESLRFDCERLGIDMRVINPGFVRTPLTDKNDFPMPFLMEPDDAARRIVEGLDGTGFEIAFPVRFVLMLKLMRLLPYRLFFPIASRLTASDRSAE